MLLLALALLGDFGLRGWIDDGRFDRLALHLWPLAIVYAAFGALAERTGRLWFVRSLYVAAVLVLVVALDLLALDGRTFHYLALSMQPFEPARVSDPTLLDTLAALSLNGIAFYAAASLLDRKSFYYAGLLNTGIGLWLIADHRQWFDKPRWAMVLIACGLTALVAGFALDARKRSR